MLKHLSPNVSIRSYFVILRLKTIQVYYIDRRKLSAAIYLTDGSNYDITLKIREWIGAFKLTLTNPGAFEWKSPQGFSNDYPVFPDCILG